MSFYIRKSLRAGPLRFNLSKSGIGVSAGITGFRVGTGPRGNYVHIGRNGMYYRTTLPSTISKKPQFASNSTETQTTTVEMKEIESESVLKLTDSSSADLLEEMNRKQNRFQFWQISAVLLATIFLALVGLNVTGLALALFLALGLVALFFIRREDQLRKTVVLFYELDDKAEKAYQDLHDAFKAISSSNKAWHISASGRITDINRRKRESGASVLVKRKDITITLKNPPYVSTNLAIPTIPVGLQTLYFFPDRVLVYEGRHVGAVSFPDLQLAFKNEWFIEAEAVPKDTRIVGHTWKYVNKNGGPDRRFKENRQLPICLYSELHFTSQSGLNELIQISKPNIGDALEESFKDLALLQQLNQITI